MPITDEQKISSSLGGAGFGRPSEAQKFSTLINNLSSDNKVKYVVICGGYNDISSNDVTITSGMSDCKSIIQSKFPNATMCVGFIGNTTDESVASYITLTRSRYQTAASSVGAVYLDNLNVLTSPDLFSSDGIHPNNAGEYAIATAVINAMNNELL